LTYRRKYGIVLIGITKGEIKMLNCGEKERRFQEINDALKKIAEENQPRTDLKMYILIREDTPIDIVPLIASHTAMLTYKRFRGHPLTKRWFETELQKTVICKVAAEQFEKAKEYGDHFALTEVHHQELGELGLGFSVQPEYHKFFKYLPLYKAE